MFKVNHIADAEAQPREQAPFNKEFATRIRGKWFTVKLDHGDRFFYFFDSKLIDRDRAAYLIATR